MEWLESESENWQPWAYGCVINMALYMIASRVGVVEGVGVSLAISVGLALAAYVQWEWRRPRVAGFCLLGTVPLWLLLLGTL